MPRSRRSIGEGRYLSDLHKDLFPSDLRRYFFAFRSKTIDRFREERIWRIRLIVTQQG
ncbi:MAG: hypothetical protein PHI23_04800 [Candidatus Peribacteraceae bacterium]|nr:hypothetical protein [Candidatus Peribacteraceae bacterium]